MRTFLTLSRKECLAYYKDILQNSDRHFKVAEILAMNKEYGNGISHLVLGTEELVKAVIIFLDGNGFSFRSRVSGIKSVFRHHYPRHLLSSVFSATHSMVNPMMDMIKSIVSCMHNEKKYEDLSELEKAFLDKDKKKMEKISKQIARKHGEILYKHMEFWDDADKIKQNGFYVDFENKLVSPRKITLRDYKRALTITSYLRRQCTDMIMYVDNLSVANKVELCKIYNGTEGFYKMVENIISPSKKNRTSQTQGPISLNTSPTSSVQSTL